MKNNPLLSVRLAGISDLIAAEGKYHLQHYVTFKIKYLNTVKSETMIKETSNLEQFPMNSARLHLKRTFTLSILHVTDNVNCVQKSMRRMNAINKAVAIFT